MTRFTPGPWAVHPRLPGVIVGGEAISVPNGTYQRQVAAANFAPEMTAEQFNANAHLIASAPDLYEALSRLVNWLDRGGEENTDELVSACDAALSRARGEL